MTSIPRREEFDVSHRVYEWLREIGEITQTVDPSNNDEAINALLALFKGIEQEIEELKNTIDENSSNLYAIESLKETVNDLVDVLDTNSLLSGKIQSLQDTVDSLPEESEISLFKAFKGLEVITSEYVGLFVSPNLTEDVPINEILGEGECFVEINTDQPVSSSTLVTSQFINNTTVRLTRGAAADSVGYSLKVKDFRNG